jgi:hypothetical protein
MRSWPSSHTILPMMGTLVRILYDLSTRYRADIPLEELLIDFQELIGEHSGENMADAVWATLELYGLIGKVSFCLTSRCVLC